MKDADKKLYSYSALNIFIALIILVFGNVSLKAQNITHIQLEKNEPDWIKETPLVFVGNWDSFPLFRTRVGNFSSWQKEDYYNQHTEEAVKKLNEMGITMAIIHFYKGFGLEAEQEHMADAKKLAGLCHKYGIKVGVYVGSTFGYEHFLLEMPEADEWIVPDYQNKPVRYGSQQFRKRPYFMHPGYRDYIKKVLHIAVKDFQADLIHFDNPANQGLPEVFHHPLAKQHFKDFLKNKYTSTELKNRLGLSDVTYIEPPYFEESLSTIDDPLSQEWIDFRCQQLSDYYKDMANYIRNLNPEVAVENNPHGLAGNNTYWNQSIDFPRMLQHLDFFWTEGEKTGLEDGTLISKIRTFKMARTLNTRVFTYSENKLEMAEALAYNRQGIGMVGDGLAGYKLSKESQQWIQFFHKNFEHYRDVESIADVAILHSSSTMAYNNDGPYQSTFLFEQVLIQEKIPFDIIFDDNLKDLSKYKVLVLANQEALNQEKLSMITEFVRNGGGLVATEHTSLYDEPRERRKQFGLQALFQVESPELRGGNPEPTLELTASKRNQIGKGRVVYISEVKPFIKKPKGASMSREYWKLPINWIDLIESIQWAAKGELTLETDAPNTVTIELNKQTTSGNIILHLVNFDSNNQNPIKNIAVSLKQFKGKKPIDIKILSPEFEPQKIQYIFDDDRIKFTIPKLNIYDVVVIQ